MAWSFKLGRLAGIPIRVHITFLLLLAWVALRAFGANASVGGALLDTVFVLAVFGSVVLHELGHALTARRFGVGTRSITLLPIGGVARLERMPRSSAEELWISLAGPAVNVVLAGVLYLASMVLGDLSSGQGWLLGQSLVASLMWANLGLAVFNLIPAFPMDGGRVARALLARRWGYLRATTIAAQVGRVFAVAFGIIGLFTSTVLVLVAVYLFFVAGRELKAARLEQARRTEAAARERSPFAAPMPGGPWAGPMAQDPGVVLWIVDRTRS